MEDVRSLPKGITDVHQMTFREITLWLKDKQQEWHNACNNELEALWKHNIYKLTDLPPSRKAIKSKWVFNIKSDSQKKARLVAKGFQQIKGIDFNQIFSPVVRYKTIHMLLALAALEQWYFLAVDIKSAYLYGPLKEEIYMEQLEGYCVQPGKVWKLLKALYGLKQAGHVWWKELKKSMYVMNYHYTKSNSGVFVHKTSNGIVIAIVYVDNSIFFGSSPALITTKHKEFMEKWECCDLGEPKEFLHMCICRPNLSNIYLDQTMYLHKVLVNFGQTNACPAPTLLPTGCYPIANQGEVNLQLQSNY
jgi:Reverse transcriptase (RNA-dependent DNA polymerase)